MVRDFVANDAATGFDSRRPLQLAPADGPVDGLLSRRCWFESNSGRHTHADGAEAAFLNLPVSIRALGATSPLKHIEMCSALVVRRQAGANPARRLLQDGSS